MNKDRYNRIVRHLDRYGNTIIVPKDLHKTKLEVMIKKLEEDGFKIEELHEKKETNKTRYGEEFAGLKHYWVIRAWRNH